MSLFWSTAAGPTFYDYINVFEPGGKFMRLTRAIKPSEFKQNDSIEFEHPEILTKLNSYEIAEFWNYNYFGDDWRMEATKEWVESLFNNVKLALGVRTKDGRLIGTILSRKIGGTLYGSNLGMSLTSDRIFMIEGLCVQTKYRGKHLASWLISWMDYFTSEHGPVAHLFSRELATIPYFSNAIEIETYGFVETFKIKESQTKPVVLLDNYVFQTKWLELLEGLNLKTKPNVALCSGIMDKDDMMCFVCWGMKNGTVVIADTHRNSIKKQKIYEVIFCMGDETELLLNSVAYELEKKGIGGLLFGTNSLYHGAINASFSEPWRFGTSGYHATYFYNYLPATRKLDFILTRNSV
jgi:hypothetical protein